MGLKETQTIGRIVIDPKDPTIVYVAALGHLFGPNGDRGIFKTIDGGKTWAKVKFVDEHTGFTDIVMDSLDSRTLYAASYQRRRAAWGMNGGGQGSGIWKTVDAGKTWTRLEGNGLPEGQLGRIGIDVCRAKPAVIYAQIEVEKRGGGGGEPPPEAAPAGQPPQAPAPPDPKRSGIWRSDDKGKTWRITSNNNNRPMYYSQVRCDPTNDQIVYTLGGPFHKSTDAGKTFAVVEGLGHGDHHALWIDPKNSQHLLVGNDGGLDVSYDQAATWEDINTMAVGQFYGIAVDMRKPYFVCGGLQDNGSSCGPSQTRNPGPIINPDWYRINSGDGMYAAIDPTDYTTVYTESQDGNITRLDLRTGVGVSIRPRARPQPGQGGRGGGGQQPATANIVPEPPAGQQYRFNWTMPIHLSPHNPRTIYVGGNRLFKSVDRGDTWTATPDLTRQIDRNTLSIMDVRGDMPMHSKHDGTSSYSNITTIAESPALPGVLWIGTDDGYVQLSRDGGATWNNVTHRIADAPERGKVSRVEPSHGEAGTCYVSFDNHRFDDLKPYLYVTRDFGATFQSLAGNLAAAGNVNVIREDPRNPNLLYVGTEFGLYISLDRGAQWKRFSTGLPTVRIDDVLVHPRDNDLVVGTHGRSIWVLDDITPLQQWGSPMLRRETTSQQGGTGNGTAPPDIELFDIRAGTEWHTDIALNRPAYAAKHFRGENPGPGTYIHYYLRAPVSGDVRITVSDINGRVVRTLAGTNDAGINRVRWDLRENAPPQGRGGHGGGGGGGAAGGGPDGPAAAPGTYLVKLSAGGKELTKTVTVERDVWMNR
ncbi:MAG: hypothetical protein HYS05_04775 [Acidobacteria bacterium]|nr:hypothetical protein [Acidobacteriota bacterium]